MRRGRDRDRGGDFRYSRRLTPCGRGLRQPPGLTALGCQGSVRDRLTPPGRVEGSALGRYIVSLRWRGTAPSAPFFIPPLAAKTIQPPCGRGKCILPLWWLASPPCPVGSMPLDSRVAGLPYESSSFATPTSWGHYKAPLCCELLMKGLLFRALFYPCAHPA